VAAAPDTSPGTVRLTELLGVLSLGTDLGMGHPMEHAIRQSLLAVRLAERAGLDEEQRAVVYYSSLVAWVGCHVDAYEQAKWFGDDRAFKADARDVDLGRPLESASYVLRHLGAGQSASARARLGVKFAGEGLEVLNSMFENHWHAAAFLVERLGLGDQVLRSVAQTFERWDGKGVPSRLRGEDVLITSRLVNLADVIEVFHARGGVSAALEVARRRSGTQFDPGLVELFCEHATALFGELDAVSGWDAAMALEPTLDRVLSEPELEDALEVVADFVDLKSPYTIGHSRAVADLAGEAAKEYGLPAPDTASVRRAGLVHDLGRLGVANTIWDKRGELTPVELERVRLHPYLTERMLAFSPGLAPLAAIAVQHHERLDGSGYPRGTRGDGLTPAGRILGAADMYQARSEPRPHRPPRAAAEVAADLRAEVRAGRLDGETVDAVLTAAGHRVSRKRTWPADLTTREVEVLRLVARGLSHKEIAERLGISPKTASNHVERIYAKIDVSNRAMATLFAVRHGLIGPDAES
jgi:HD-GYP domain-containing protein (c-di-GMP phosphodiesterase class II)